MKRTALLLALALGGSCDPGEDASEPGGSPLTPPLEPPLELPAFPLRPVVAEALRALEDELPVAPPLEPADAEHVRGLASMMAGSAGDMASLARAEALGLGDAAVPELSRLVLDGGAADAERAVAIELLAALDTPAAAEALVSAVTGGEPTFVRAQAAYQLRKTTQDQVLPALVLRLKYEKDYETVLWLADTLSHFENHAGLAGAFVIWRDESTPELAVLAAERLAMIAERANTANEAPAEGLQPQDAAPLLEAWDAGTVPAPTRSRRYDRAVWRWIERFTEFQLRGVDDARFLLSRSDARAVELMAEALHDESLYVRVHTAQSLQRMGPRAAPAGPALLAALADPGVAPNAADALGAIGYLPAADTLVELARRNTPLELRLAAVRALGALGTPVAERAEPVFRDIVLREKPVELCQAAAEGMLGIRADQPLNATTREFLKLVALFVIDDRVAFESSERAIRAWLIHRTLGSSPDSWNDYLARWDALAPPPEVIVTSKERRRIRERRQDIVTEILALGTDHRH